MFEHGGVEARSIRTIGAIVLLGVAIAANCQTQPQGAKVQEQASTDTTKAEDSKAQQSPEKPKKDADPSADRQKQLADDTAKLLLLANELKVEMDKSSKDTLSLTVVKKAEEVEKLAHKVREEMKKSMGN